MSTSTVHRDASLALAILDLSLVPKRWEQADAAAQYAEACNGPEWDPCAEPPIADLRWHPEREWGGVWS